MAEIDLFQKYSRSTGQSFRHMATFYYYLLISVFHICVN